MMSRVEIPAKEVDRKKSKIRGSNRDILNTALELYIAH